MGRHAATGPQLERPVELSTFGPAPQSGSKQPLVPAEFRPIVLAASALLVLILVIVAIALGRGTSSGTATSSIAAPGQGAPVSADQRFTWGEEYATPGWATEENQAVFGQAMNAYLRQYSGPALPATLSGAGISDCIVLRASRPDQLESAATDPGTLDTTTAWAILNAAIDTYCPEQAAHRNDLTP